MPLIFKINLILIRITNFFIVAETANNQVPTYIITDTKLNVSIVTLSTEDIVKPLLQLKIGFKIMSNWKKYQSKVSIEGRNQYLDFQVDPNF